MPTCTSTAPPTARPRPTERALTKPSCPATHLIPKFNTTAKQSGPSPLWPLTPPGSSPASPRPGGGGGLETAPQHHADATGGGLPADLAEDIAARVLGAGAGPCDSSDGDDLGRTAEAAEAAEVRRWLRLVSRSALAAADGSARWLRLPAAQAAGLPAAAPRLGALRGVELLVSPHPPAGGGAGTLRGGSQDVEARAALAALAAALPALPQLESLKVRGSPPDGAPSTPPLPPPANGPGALDGVARLVAAAASLRQLASLDLSGVVLGAGGGAALEAALAAGAWGDLQASGRALWLRCAGRPALAALAGTGHLRRLAAVSLEACHGAPNALQAVAAARWAGGLRALRLSQFNLQISGEHAPEPGALVGLSSLEELSLIRCGAGDGGAAALAAAPLPALRRLRMRRCALVFGPAALVQAPWAAGLEELDISGNQVVNGAFSALCKAELPRLRALDIREVSPSPGAASELSQAPWLPGLERLSVAGNSAALLAALVAAPMPALRRLRLEGTTPGTAAALAGAAWLGGLAQLILVGGEAGGVAALPELAALRCEGRLRVQAQYEVD